MFSVKKALLGFAMFSTLLSFQSTPAQAVVLEFETSYQALISGEPWHVVLAEAGIGHAFEFQNVTMTFDTTAGGTGRLNLNGQLRMLLSDEIWNMNAFMDDVSLAYGSLPGTVPYDGMFADMITNPAAVLTHDDLFFQITPTVPSPAYTGATTGSELFLNSMPGMGGSNIHTSEIQYRKFGALGHVPFDYYGLSAWFQDPNGNHFGDFHFVFFNPTVIPEPATIASFLIGLGGLAVRRFRQKLAV